MNGSANAKSHHSGYNGLAISNLMNEAVGKEDIEEMGSEDRNTLPKRFN